MHDIWTLLNGKNGVWRCVPTSFQANFGFMESALGRNLRTMNHTNSAPAVHDHNTITTVHTVLHFMMPYDGLFPNGSLAVKALKCRRSPLT